MTTLLTSKDSKNVMNALAQIERNVNNGSVSLTAEDLALEPTKTTRETFAYVEECATYFMRYNVARELASKAKHGQEGLSEVRQARDESLKAYKKALNKVQFSDELEQLIDETVIYSVKAHDWSYCNKVAELVHAFGFEVSDKNLKKVAVFFRHAISFKGATAKAMFEGKILSYNKKETCRNIARMIIVQTLKAGIMPKAVELAA